MIAAIYARKSTEQFGVTEEEKSVTRQVEHARAYAAKNGWTICEEHIFIDDGISGAEFLKRPGFLRLMNSLKPRPRFDILVMSEESRLGREQIETAYALKQLTDAGIRLFFYLEDRERKLDNAIDKVMLSLTNFAAECERERARQRTYDALLRKAKNGHVTGGRVFGYNNREVTSSDGQRLHVIRVVDDTQAEVVRRIFSMYADKKMGLTRIAKTLNDEGIIPPRKAQGWAPSAIREMLYRPLYRGEIVWNEHQKVERGGTKLRKRRSEDQFIKIQAPDLRIISEDLWARVHDRLKQAKNVYMRSCSTGMAGKLLGRPRMRDFESPFLLSGLARCSACGGPIDALGRDYKRGKGEARAGLMAAPTIGNAVRPFARMASE
jgi:site-specific DNA recombinase